MLYHVELYWVFLGVSQVLAAFLLMTQRFATIGALLFFAIISNILVITLSFDNIIDVFSNHTFNIWHVIRIHIYVKTIATATLKVVSIKTK